MLMFAKLLVPILFLFSWSVYSKIWKWMQLSLEKQHETVKQRYCWWWILVKYPTFKQCWFCVFVIWMYCCFKTMINVWKNVTCVSRCIPKYRVCLSDLSDCPQYECVGRPGACDKNSVELVCDTDGVVHPSLCHLQHAGKILAYMGHCQVCYHGWPVLGDTNIIITAIACCQ